MVMELILDPFVHFVFGAIVTPPFVVDDDKDHQRKIQYFTHWSLIGGVVVTLLIFLERKYGGFNAALTKTERAIARWYLLNGIFINILLDGTFQLNPVMAQQYDTYDKRYSAPWGSFLGSAVHITSVSEFIILCPGCIWLYRAYWRGVGTPLRDLVEVVLCTCQAYGTVVYIFQEVVTGMKNLQVDWNLTFSPFHLFYFWFAFVFANPIWIVVPCLLGWRAAKRILAHGKTVNQRKTK